MIVHHPLLPLVLHQACDCITLVCALIHIYMDVDLQAHTRTHTHTHTHTLYTQNLPLTCRHPQTKCFLMSLSVGNIAKL